MHLHAIMSSKLLTKEADVFETYMCVQTVLTIGGKITVTTCKLHSTVILNYVRSQVALTCEGGSTVFTSMFHPTVLQHVIPHAAWSFCTESTFLADNVLG